MLNKIICLFGVGIDLLITVKYHNHGCSMLEWIAKLVNMCNRRSMVLRYYVDISGNVENTFIETILFICYWQFHDYLLYLLYFNVKVLIY